ncbi:MAG: MFS transporter [Acidobacteria bacterium]|nr:MFS transporter [Acidobacteriota bacterium]
MTSKPWLFVPSQYVLQAIPYVAVNYLSVVIYTRLGVSEEAIGVMTSLISLPWVIKPLWSPLVDWVGTRRAWHLWSTVAVAACLFIVAFAFRSQHAFGWSLVVFAVCGFVSATYDIATDGYYLHALSEKHQAFFSGIRSFAWRLGFMFTQGFLVFVAGMLEIHALKRGGDQIFDQARSILAIDHHMEASDVDDWVLADETVKDKIGDGGPEKAAHILRLELVDRVVRLANRANRTKNLAAKSTEDFEKTVAAEIKKRTKAAMKSKKPTEDIAESTRAEFIEKIQPEKQAWAERTLAQCNEFLSRQRQATAQNWFLVFLGVGVLVLLLAVYHAWILPRPPSDVQVARTSSGLGEGAKIFISFFKQPQIGLIVTFILLYRFGEAFLVRMASVFLLRDLGLTDAEYAFGYSVLGLFGLIIGGIGGGWLISVYGLRRTIWPLALAMNLPDLLYVYMAVAKPPVVVVYALIGIEQLGYGLGFSAFMVFLMYVSRGPYRTAHYAIATGLMALAMMVAGALSGYMISGFGYVTFFVLVTLCTIPGMALIPFLNWKALEPNQS